ncbi:17231_t:CDS:2 [Cetraspora pellucida]|uniref:17231_t:CDS:1 n=1 Tax=Cetraspora pellucida TaxID=1433469 RepID=A0A9N8ZHJ7_9GLOM|nr:17231_t:CDS:2 [Cetraspora pellucida]
MKSAQLVVFITIEGQSLIWGVYDISLERSQTQNVINHIEYLITKAEKNKINIKTLVSDFADKYVSAHTQKLSDDIADIINDTQFWIILTNLQNLLYPLCGFLNKLQKDTAQLYEVLYCFGYIIKMFESHQDFEFRIRIKRHIKSHWNEWKQPILLLSFVLHLQYKLTKFNTIVANFSWTYIGQWLKYYYKTWFNSKLTSILSKLIQYKRGNDLYDIGLFVQFNGNLVDFWKSIEGIVSNNEYEGNVEKEATRFSNAEEADTRSSNIKKAATRSSNVEETAAGSSNIKEATTRFRNWTNKNFKNEDLVIEEEQQ